MPIMLFEIKRNRLSLIIWSAVLSFLIAVCVFIYPEIAKEMESMKDIFANMGAFSDAFGLDQLQFGEFMGYFAIECAETLGIGGAIFAALLGVNALGKEERERTAEFLFTHPVTRTRVVLEKLLAVVSEILMLNISVALVTIASVALISVEADYLKLLLIFLSLLILQIEIAVICFTISSFLVRGGVAVGIGVAIGSYFLNIISNISEDAVFLKYITPFGYTDGGYINEHASLDIKYLVIHLIVTAILAMLSFYRYNKKDIL